jgi:hypothetical protein
MTDLGIHCDSNLMTVVTHSSVIDEECRVMHSVLQFLVIADVVPSSVSLFTLIMRRHVPPKRRFS